MRFFLVTIPAALCATLLLTVATREAQSQTAPSKAAAAPPAGNKAACPPYADGKKFDASPIVDAIDTNHDNKLTHDEWQKAGAPEGSWNRFMGYEKVKQQGYISRADFLAETPPNGVDANCDGKITLEEFLTFSNSMGPPPAGANTGGPPPGAPPKQP
jgi:EF hand